MGKVVARKGHVAPGQGFDQFGMATGRALPLHLQVDPPLGPGDAQLGALDSSEDQGLVRGDHATKAKLHLFGQAVGISTKGNRRLAGTPEPFLVASGKGVKAAADRLAKRTAWLGTNRIRLAWRRQDLARFKQ